MIAEVIQRGWEFVFPTTLLVLALALVGEAVRRVFARWTSTPVGIAPSVALGAAIVGIALTWANFLHIPIVPVTWTIIGLSLAGLLVGWLRAHVVDGRLHGVRPALTHEAKSLLKVDVAAAAVATIVLSPLLRHGATFWTAWANDFPSYVGYAQAWLAPGTGPGSYLARHPDPFGVYMAFNADLDKPGVTGVLTFAQTVTLTPVFELLSPFVWVILATTIGIAARIIHRFLSCPWYLALAVGLLPTISVVPFTRLLDNQLGQGFLVIFCLLALLMLSGLGPSPSHKNLIAASSLMGVLIASGLNTNYSTLLAFAPAFLVLVIGLLAIGGGTLGRSLAVVAGVGAVALVLEIPLLNGVIESFMRNLSGTVGQTMAFPSALALVGQQVSVESSFGLRQAFLTWTIALLVASLFLWGGSLSGRVKVWASIGGLVVVLNILVIVARVGPDNYASHKWMALFISVAGPFLVLLGFRLSNSLPSYVVVGTTVFLTISAMAIAGRTAWSVPFVVPRDLISLQDNTDLRQLGSVNVALGNYYEDAIAAAVLPSSTITIVGPTYARGGTASGQVFLVRVDEFESNRSGLLRLNKTYGLVNDFTRDN